MLNKLILSLTIIIILIAGAVSLCDAQVIYGRPTAGNTRIFYTYWEIENNNETAKISQWMFPINGFVPLRENMELLFYSANSTNNLETPGKSYALNGLGDLRLQVNHSFYNDQILVSTGISLPTGKRELNLNNQYQIIDYLSKNYLGFPMRKFGEGFNANIMLGGARMVGLFRTGAGISYRYNSKYIPYNNNKEYKPGDFFSATASIDLTRNRYYIAGDFTFTTYLDDKIDNLKIFRQSNQFVTRFRSGYNTSTTQTGFEILYIIRGDNKQYSTLNDIEIDPSKFFGNEFRINSKHTTFFADDWRLSPSVEWKYIGADDRGNASAHIFGFGWSVGRNIGKNNILEIGFRYFSGKANGGNIDLKGLEIMSSLTASF